MREPGPGSPGPARAAWLAAGLLLAASPVAAEPRAHVEPAVEAGLRRGRMPFGLAPLPREQGEPLAPVTLVLRGPAGQAELEALERLEGVRLRRPEGRPLHRGRLVPAELTVRGLEAVCRLGWVERVAAGIGPGHATPLWHTSRLVGVQAARTSWRGDERLTGAGTLLADLDTAVDVYHPDFFRANGGAYDWIDLGGDGRFDPGVDAVDLDRDGRAGPDEVLRVLRARPVDPYLEASELPVRPEGFDPAWDWLYADTDRSGLREVGPAAGFGERSPAYGEPLFVVDDVDGDGALEPGERLFRLSSSRIRAVYLLEGGRVFHRGGDLLELPEAALGVSAETVPVSYHGTGVVGIAAGGTAAVHGRAMTGLAPEAEVIVGVFGRSHDLLTLLLWALGEGADVVLHEYAPWVGVPLDGSDVLGEAIDGSSRDDGTVHVCPVGNLGGKRKHAAVEVGPGETRELALEVPAEGYRALGLTLHVLEGRTLAVTLVLPDGSRARLSDAPGSLDLGGATGWVGQQLTPAGTWVLDLEVTGAVRDGTYRLVLEDEAGLASAVHAYVQDDRSGWGLGAAFAREHASDASTIGLPATSAGCIAVGAFTGHVTTRAEPWWRYSGGAGELRASSGRGPRIDGLPKPDLVAPDNPLTPFPRWDRFGLGPGAAMVFGGTSGAGPHVAGAALLLVQAGVEPGRTVAEALLEGAVEDALTGPVPNAGYGRGRLSLAAVLGQPGTGTPPGLVLEAPARVEPGETVVVHPVVTDPDGDPSAVELRWDDGYDGLWDGPFAEPADLVVRLDELGPHPFKAEVRDRSGLTARAVVWVAVGDPGGDGDGDADADAEAADAEPEPDRDAEAGSEPEADLAEAGPEIPRVRGRGGCGCRAAGLAPARPALGAILARSPFAAQYMGIF